MKGLIVSLFVFAAYVLATFAVARLWRVKRHGRLFFRSIAIWSPIYFLAYYCTPSNLWILPQSWLGVPAWLELLYGYVIFLLNCHSYIDFFFGFVAGFSMTLLRDILLAGPQGRTTAELLAGFQMEDGQDKAYRRRIPHLAEAGMITVEEPGQICHITPQGRRWAMILSFFKKLLNIAKGG